MEGLCPRCLKPVHEGRFCPHCGRDLLQGLPGKGQSFYTAPVEPGEFYTAPIRRAEPVQPVQPATPPVQPVTPPVQPISQPVQPVTQPVQPAAKPKRVRKLPILLGAIACIGVLLLLPEEDREEVLPEPAQIPAPAMPEITTGEEELLFSFRAEDLSVTVDENRLITAVVSGLDLKDTYPVNLPQSEAERNEYSWRVRCDTESDAMILSVRHFKEANSKPAERSIEQMEGILFLRDNHADGDEERFYILEAEVEIDRKGEDLILKCALPEQDSRQKKPLAIDVSAFTEFTVSFTDFVNDTDMDRVYAVNAPNQAHLFSYQAEDFSFTVDADRRVTVTTSNLPLREQYTVNLPSSSANTVEFSWSVYAESPARTLRFMTYHSKQKDGKENRVISLSDMKTLLFMEKEEEPGSFASVQKVPLSMTHTANSITWTCTLPETWPDAPDEPFPVDPASFTGFKVDVHDANKFDTPLREYEIE